MAINIPIITSFVNTGIQAADKQLKKFGTSAQAVAGAAGGLSIAFATVKSVIGPAITAASNLQESMSKVNVIFGKELQLLGLNFPPTLKTVSHID